MPDHRVTRRNFTGLSLASVGAAVVGGCEADDGGPKASAGEILVPAAAIPVMLETDVLVLG